jgi:DNA-binding NarL/FixJ family response regulator
MKIRIFLVDDHSVLRDGLRALLESAEDMEVIGEASDGREALRGIESLKPDIAVMDISMPEMGGIEAAEIAQERCPGVKVIMLSMVSDAETIFRALRAGASGYLLKSSAGREVVQAVRAVHGGKRYLSDKVTASMVESYGREQQEKSPLETLSRRERQVLQHLAEGRSAPEIGKLLSISSRTVETYRSRLMEKLAVKDIRGLTLFAVKHGIITGD